MQTDRNVNSATDRETPTTSPILVALAWLFVAIPAGWGIYNTLLNAMKLFQINR